MYTKNSERHYQTTYSGGPAHKEPLLRGEHYGDDSQQQQTYSSERSGMELSSHQEEEGAAGAAGQLAADGAATGRSDPANDAGRADFVNDFEEELKAAKERTEVDVPFVTTQCADAMYLDQHTVVTLEYHYYQNDAVYTRLGGGEVSMDKSTATAEARGDLLPSSQDRSRRGYLLATDRYEADPSAVGNPNSQFDRCDLRNLYDCKQDLASCELGKQNSTYSKVLGAQDAEAATPQAKQRTNSMQKGRTIKKQDSEEPDLKDRLIEGIVAMYKVSNTGGMQRINEHPLHMGRAFVPSLHGNMQFTRSRDKRLISIANFQRASPNGDHFKVLAWTTKLKPFEVSEALNQGLNKYYISVEETFHELVEVAFVGRSTYLQLVYVEAKERSLAEQQEYEREIDAEFQLQQATGRTASVNQSFSLRGSKRKARKYVYFEASTGQVLFEFAGIKKPQIVKNQNGAQVELYELGLRCKEIREENFKPYLYFYLAGDFLSTEQKNKQIIFKWSLIYLGIDMEELFGQQGGLAEKQKWLENRFAAAIPGGQEQDSNAIPPLNEQTAKVLMLKPTETQSLAEVFALKKYYRRDEVKKTLKEREYKQVMEDLDRRLQADETMVSLNSNQYLFDEAWIQRQRFNWEYSITVSANRKFDQFCLINSPQTPTHINNNSIYVNGPVFKSRITNGSLDVPFFVKLPNDATISHGRNAVIKNELFYTLEQQGVIKTVCLRLEKQETNKRVKQFYIDLQGCLSQHDCWLQQKKVFQVVGGNSNLLDICQTLSVQNDGEYALLQTRVPTQFIGACPTSFQNIERRTSTFSQQQGDHPFIAYNLGSSKVVFQSTLRSQKNYTYILDMLPADEFICFVNFNHFDDIGFFPEELRIECCSHFAFLTQNDELGEQQGNRLNLVLMDPFYAEFQGAWFRSSSFFDNDMVNSGEFVINAFIQSNMSRKTDLHYKSYIWTQHPTKLIRSKLIKKAADAKDRKKLEDSDNDLSEDDIIKRERHEDDFDLLAKEQFEKLKMVQDSRGFIYYITQQQGESSIMEGNPRDPYEKHHYPIFSLKTSRCLAFSCVNDRTFYLMNDEHLVYKLCRNENNRQLYIEKEVTLKEIQRYDFQPNPFDDFLLSEKFAVFKSKMFYFYSAEPFPEGIFEADNLVEDEVNAAKKEFLKGPYKIGGSSQFFCVYQQNKFKSFMRLFQSPDSVQKTLVNDFQNFVDMSTFDADGNILIRSRRRFMAFSSAGKFLDEVGFDDKGKTNSIQEVTLKDWRQTAHKPTAPQNANSNEEPILDFNGNVYDIDLGRHQPALSEHNKMELLNFSRDQKLFLFHDRLEERLFVYELKRVRAMPDDDEAVPRVKGNSQFVFSYELRMKDCQLFQHLYDRLGVDAIDYYTQNSNLVAIDTAGSVKFCYCECINKEVDNMSERSKKAGTDGEEAEQQEPGRLQVRLLGAVFQQVKEQSKDGKSLIPRPYSRCLGYNQLFEFPDDAHGNLTAIIEDQKKKIRRQVTQIRIQQTRWPHVLHDYSQYDNLLHDLHALESVDSTSVYAKFYCEGLLVIYCGNYLKFGWVQPNKAKQRPGEQMDDYYQYTFKQINGVMFQDIDCVLTSDTEIMKVVETAAPNVLQIVTKSHAQGFITILTWDFVQNIEWSQQQVILEESDFVGNHVVKGMNEKMNYYIDQNFLTDLEYNIPIRQKNVNQHLDPREVSYTKQIQNINELYNQQKVFEDHKQFLGIEKAHIMFYDLSKIDILLWKNLCDLNENPHIVEKSCTLEQFNLCFHGASLFHYFAASSEIIEIIIRKIAMESVRELSASDKMLPLQILNPNNDGRTALYLAIQSQSPKSFELMIESLTGFKDICTTKMMLKSLALVVSNECEKVINFFDESFFQPPQMRIEQFVPWKEDLEQAVFASHTAVISPELLLEKLAEHGIDTQSALASPGRRKQQGGKSKTYKEIIALKKDLRPLKLAKEFDAGLAEGEEPLKRVTVEALDFDWLFENDNAKTLLQLLASDANSSTLTRKSIKIFIELMWEHYQPAISKYMFFPYCIYLCIINYNSGALMGNYLDSLTLANLPETDSPAIRADLSRQRTMGLILNSLALIFLVCFASLEVRQLRDDGVIAYFADVWNVIDSASVGLNFTTIFMFMACLIYNDEVFDFTVLHAVAAFACFCMWLKIFYWCRLFSSLAYYVKLIQQTVGDCVNFLFMCLVICISFGSYLYVADRQLDGTNDSYIGEYFDYPLLDSVVSIYVIGALGNFSTSRFRVGPSKYAVMSMFLVSTFFVSVVFMNMLIAIMSDTFAQVLEGEEENGLREQIVLMSDHLFLLDIQKIFRGQKYILVVTPSTSQQTEEDPAAEKIQQAQDFIERKIDHLGNNMARRVGSVQETCSFLLQNQYTALEMVMHRLRDIDTSIAEGAKSATARFNQTENVQAAGPETAAQKKKKKNALCKSINLGATHVGKLTPEKVQAMAMEWIELVDVDRNGAIELDEFVDFFRNIDGVYMSDEEIEQMFRGFDRSGDGSLTPEEFAHALYVILVPEGHEDDAEDGGDAPARAGADPEDDASDGGLEPDQ